MNDTTSGIVTRGVLVDLTVSRFMSSRTDRNVTEEVRQQHNAQGNVGRYAKRLFPQDPKEMKKVKSVANAAEQLHRESTLPWMTGWRILPRELHSDYVRRIAQHRAEMEDAIQELVRALPRLKDEAKQLLSTLYRDDDYPDARELERAFSIDIRFMPVPDVGDFRVQLDAESLAEMKRQYEAEMQESMQAAVGDLWVRLRKVLESLSEACAREKAPDKGALIIRAAVIENVRELLAAIPNLNITNDPQLEALRAEINRKLGKVAIETLREDEAARKETKAVTDAILKKMAPFMQAK